MKETLMVMLIFFILISLNPIGLSSCDSYQDPLFSDGDVKLMNSVSTLQQDELIVDLKIRELNGIWQDENITVFQGSVLECKLSIYSNRGFPIMTGIVNLPSIQDSFVFDFIEGSEKSSKRAAFSEANDEVVTFIWAPLLFSSSITSSFKVTVRESVNKSEVFGIAIGIVDNVTFYEMNDSVLVTSLPSPIPLIPDRPIGPDSGKSGIEYNFTTCTTDPNDDFIYYKWDWGDQTAPVWMGPYESGEIVNISHSWDEPGSYTIRVKARDEDLHESDWSEPLRFSIPKSRSNLDRISDLFDHLSWIKSFFIRWRL